MQKSRNLIFIFLFASLLAPATASASSICAQLVKSDSNISIFSRSSRNFIEAIAERWNPADVPQGTIQVGSIAVPRRSATSLWRAVVVVPEMDRIDTFGYQSGWERSGPNVPDWQKAKYNFVDGRVDYSFADRKVVVSAKVARALEFSYLDPAHPYSPKNSTVVGLHENLEHILTLVRQSGAEILQQPGAYIRVDEISTQGLTLTSAEALFNRFGLRNPIYDPKGEWISDGSIPRDNILQTYKFKAVREFTSLSKTCLYEKGDEVYYTALNGQKYLGRIASDRVIDGFVTLSYYDRHGSRRFDIAELSHLTPTSRLDKPDDPFLIDTTRFERGLRRPRPDMTAILESLKKDRDLAKLFDSSAGTAERYTIGQHTLRVWALLLEFLHAHRGLQNVRLPSGTPPLEFLAKIIAIHDIGKSRAMANEGLGKQYKYTLPIARKLLRQFGISYQELALAEAIIDNDSFGRVFNARTPEKDKLTPEGLFQLLRSRAEDISIPVQDLYALHLAFYLSDAGSYPVVRDQYFHVDGSGRLVPRDPRFQELERLVYANRE